VKNLVGFIKDQMDKIQVFVESVEDSKTPMIYFILTFLFAVTLRNFFDTITDTTVSLETRFSIGLHGVPILSFIENTLWYINLALILVIVLHFASRVRVDRILRLVLPGFLVLLTVSFVDFILSGGVGFDQSYMLPELHRDVLLRWVTFSIPYHGRGVTPGMITESMIVMIALFGYIYIKTRSIVRGLVFTYLAYTATFFWGAMPFALKSFLGLFGLEYLPTPLLSMSFMMLISLPLGILLYYLYNRDYFVTLLRDIPVFRVLHYELMFILGIFLGMNIFHKTFEITVDNLFQWFFTPIAVFFAGVCSLIVNNLHDYPIDEVSNVSRSTVTGAIPLTHYKQLAIVSFILAFLYSVVVSFVAAFLIIVGIGNYFLYSAPPFRLKRVPFFSKFFISLNSLLLVLVGYYYVTGTTDIPLIIFLFFLVGFTAFINFIDIKDYEGDKKAGILTIPTMLGLKKGKFLIGLFFLLGYIGMASLLKDIVFSIFMLIVGVSQFLLINRRNYDEKPVFALYLLSLVVFILYTTMYPLSFEGFTP